MTPYCLPSTYQHDPLALTLAPPGSSSSIVSDMPQKIPVTPQFSASWSNLHHTKKYDSLKKFQDIASYSQNRNPPPMLGVDLVVQEGNEPNIREQTRTNQPSRRCRKRKVSKKTCGEGKEKTTPPYLWAQSRPARIYSLEYLLSNGIEKITGEVQCKQCNQKYDIVYDLNKKIGEIASYILRNKSSMHHRAPPQWMNPKLPDCGKCRQKNCIKPVISKEREINWLFLLLGEMLGCCKLEELKYFCKHTENHRTGAKDRVLYLTYLELCKQLDPKGPFHIDN